MASTYIKALDHLAGLCQALEDMQTESEVEQDEFGAALHIIAQHGNMKKLNQYFAQLILDSPEWWT